MSSLGLIELPAPLGRFHRDHPEVSVRLATAASCGGSPELIAALTEGRLDLAFVSIPTLDWPISLATPAERTPSAAARAFERLVDRHLAERS
ncbi:LysR substrate-binding domain-containing protein [Streptomyces asiaticus]